MSRSIHSTDSEYHRERRFRYADEDTKHERLVAIRAQIEKKQRIKSGVRREREAPLPPHLPAAAPEAIPIDVVEQGPWIHYPASPGDVQAVMRRLPVGVLTGLSSIQLCLGSEHQEEDLSVPERADAERDPWVGRVGFESLPGLFRGRCMGTYWYPSARIELYAYVYDPALPERALWEFYLRLQMLSVFVHEVAHHDDWMRRTARGRWCMDDTDKDEAYAVTTQANWVQQCVVPYLEEAYPDAIRDLNAWVRHHGGIAIPLALLAGGWRWDAAGKVVLVSFGSAQGAFDILVKNVHEGRALSATRLGFARDLHYGANYTEALGIIGRVLEGEPANLEALTLEADICTHQGEYQRAEVLARQVVSRDQHYVDAWMVLADVHEAQQDWQQLLVAAGRGMAPLNESGWKWYALLEHRARANLELANFTKVAVDLDTLAQSRSRRLKEVALALRALMFLRTGQWDDALQLASMGLAQTRLTCAPIFTAVRFEAAHKLGRPVEGGELSAEVLNTLRRLNYGSWVDRLIAGYGLARG